MKPLAQNSLIQGRYLVVQLIGKGGMGEVYLAVDQRLGSAVALKRTFFAGDEMLGNAFEREARTLARLRHPVLPKVSDHFGEGDEQYLVMEHISGDDLAKRIESAQKSFPLSWVMFWADQLLDALSYLHSHEPPIIHRDIKPQNLKLTDENHIVLLDFGLSKSSTGKTNISSMSGAGSSTGSVVGYTPHYAPMEQIRGIGTSPKSDLYSLSATLYQLLSNTVPSDALTRADAMLNGMPDTIRPLNELNPEVPPAVAEVIAKGMEVSQERRFVSAREMQKALRKAFASMQDAMSAQTVAFTSPAIQRGVTDQPIAPSMDKTEIMDFGQFPDHPGSIRGQQLGSSQPGPADPGNSNPQSDFASPTVIEAPASDSLLRQSDVKTEVFLAGSNSLPIPDRETSQPDSLPPTPNAAPDTTDFRLTEEISSVGDVNGDGPIQEFSADSTMPNVAFQGESARANTESPAEVSSFYTTPGFAPETTEPRSFEKPVEEIEEPPAAYVPHSAASPAVAAVPQKKSSTGKIVAIFGGLIALFVLAAAGIGGGWYVYNNYYAGATVEPTPSPEESVEPTPSPEPTLSSVVDNSNSDVNVAPTPEPTLEPTPEPTQVDGPGTTRTPRPTPQTSRPPTNRPPQTPRPTPTRPTTPKPTPLQ
jgi:serine/threonine protein kinase